MMGFYVKPKGIVRWMRLTMIFRQIKSIIQKTMTICLMMMKNSKGNNLYKNNLMKILKICNLKLFLIMIFYKLIQ